MMNLQKIDKTLSDRHRIVSLLNAIKRDDITMGEMEEIGTKLRKSGKRALSPLMRTLWREKNGDLLSRYTYLLDFFEEESWLDQLIKLTLQRQDLEEEAKTALLGALEGYGIDVASPPFDQLLADLGGPLPIVLPKMLAKGDQGIAWFLDDFLRFPIEVQASLIREMPAVGVPGVVLLLETLLGVEQRDVCSEALYALGKIRTSRSATALVRYAEESGDPSLRAIAEKNIRRLSFVGITADEVTTESLPLHATFASGIDYTGSRSLLFVHRHLEAFKVLHLHIHDMEGVQEAFNYGSIAQGEYDAIVSEVRTKEGVRPVASAYALQLLGDGLYKSRQRELFLPADFYVYRKYFEHKLLLDQAEFTLSVEDNVKNLASSQQLFAETGTLLDDEHFEGWFVTSSRVYDLAEEWGSLEERVGLHRLKDELDGLVSRFCAELIAPERAQIARRLLLQGDFLVKVGANSEVVEKTLAVAGHVLHSRLPLQFHPFFRRLALESMEAAREALAEGYDLRDIDDEGWFDDDRE